MTCRRRRTSSWRPDLRRSSAASAARHSLALVSKVASSGVAEGEGHGPATSGRDRPCSGWVWSGWSCQKRATWPRAWPGGQAASTCRDTCSRDCLRATLEDAAGHGDLDVVVLQQKFRGAHGVVLLGANISTAAQLQWRRLQKLYAGDVEAAVDEGDLAGDAAGQGRAEEERGVADLDLLDVAMQRGALRSPRSGSG
jgi:hypothetical protein